MNDATITMRYVDFKQMERDRNELIEQADEIRAALLRFYNLSIKELLQQYRDALRAEAVAEARMAFMSGKV